MDPIDLQELRLIQLAHKALVLFDLPPEYLVKVLSFTLGRVDGVYLQGAVHRPIKAPPSARERKLMESRVVDSKEEIVQFFGRPRSDWTRSPRPEAIEWLACQAVRITGYWSEELPRRIGVPVYLTGIPWSWPPVVVLSNQNSDIHRDLQVVVEEHNDEMVWEYIEETWEDDLIEEDVDNL